MNNFIGFLSPGFDKVQFQKGFIVFMHIQGEYNCGLVVGSTLSHFIIDLLCYHSVSPV